MVTSATGGARVIATASNEEDSEACLAVGADTVVNHRSESFAEQVLDETGGHPVDRVIDVEFGANLQTSIDVIRGGGTIATYSSTVVPEPQLPILQMMYKDLTVRLIIVYAMPEPAKQAAITDIADALDKGQLTHRIAQNLPLSEIAIGNALVEEGKIRGCVVLDID
jgi:NADPH2:quinone reductase